MDDGRMVPTGMVTGFFPSDYRGRLSSERKQQITEALNGALLTEEEMAAGKAAFLAGKDDHPGKFSDLSSMGMLTNYGSSNACGRRRRE